MGRGGRDGGKRGGGRGGGGAGGGGLPREVQVSKKVSWLLRHGAEKEGLELGKGGYVNVKDVLNTRCLRSLNVTFAELKVIVAENEKQRFSLIPATSPEAATGASSSTATESNNETPLTDPSATLQSSALDSTDDDPSHFLIRANQGHSLKIDTEGLLTPITLDVGNLPEMAVHGTDERGWNLILKSGGLRPMGRMHVHFAKGLPKGFKPVSDDDASNAAATAPQAEEEQKSMVISGMRNSSTILIYVDLPAALSATPEPIPFFLSENEVILSPGDRENMIPVRFFKRVEDRRGGGKALMRDGRLVSGEDVQVDLDAWKAEVQAKGKGGRRRGGGGGDRGRGRGGGHGRGQERAKVVDDSGDLMAGV